MSEADRNTVQDFLDTMEEVADAVREAKPPVVNVETAAPVVNVSPAVNVHASPAVVNVEQPKMRTLKMSGTYNGKAVNLTISVA